MSPGHFDRPCGACQQDWTGLSAELLMDPALSQSEAVITQSRDRPCLPHLLPPLRLSLSYTGVVHHYVFLRFAICKWVGGGVMPGSFTLAQTASLDAGQNGWR